MDSPTAASTQEKWRRTTYTRSRQHTTEVIASDCLTSRYDEQVDRILTTDQSPLCRFPTHASASSRNFAGYRDPAMEHRWLAGGYRAFRSERVYPPLAQFVVDNYFPGDEADLDLQSILVPEGILRFLPICCTAFFRASPQHF
ncbi:hypothetical protein [Lacipirellula sp.]|uniref:hypothetical protein n=1 Tax=Lacipirellula sp. TaxID=2691419 RepID=UPI003D141D12